MEENYFKYFSPEKIHFFKRPLSLPANERLKWKVAFIFLILGKFCKNNSCSLKKMNLLISGSQFEDGGYQLDEVILRQNRLAASLVKFDPSLPRVLNYMNANGWLTLDSGKYVLSDSGKNIANKIEPLSDLFRAERAILEKFKSRDLSEANIERLLRNW